MFNFRENKCCQKQHDSLTTLVKLKMIAQSACPGTQSFLGLFVHSPHACVSCLWSLAQNEAKCEAIIQVWYKRLYIYNIFIFTTYPKF